MGQSRLSPVSDVAKHTYDFLAGGGEMGECMRAKDWSGTPLGPPETWSQSIKTAISICLNSRFPILLWLGPELRLVYNDAYIPFLGETKHPAALGAPGREVWSEIWSAIGPMHEEVAAGRATSVDDFQMFFARRLPREEVYVTFGYSPILGEDGRTIEGVFCACTETTEKIVGERRLSTLRDLGARRRDHRTAEIAYRDAAEVLQANPLDISFAAIYLLDEQGATAHLVAGTRLPNDPAAFRAAHPATDGDEASQPWPLARVAATGRLVEVNDLTRRMGFFPAGPWPDAVDTAFVLPLSPPTQARPAGFLIAGVSPRRVLDAGYRSFLDLVASHIATSIADARAFEAERKRAEALAELDRAKTAFFSNVSHEFRTPLTLMLSPLEEILAKPETEVLPESRTLVRFAHRNALRLLRLVNTLLDFSRAEAGRMEASYEPVDFSAFTAYLAANFRSACERAGLALDVDCPPLGEPVYVDREMWEKIVLNLLSNAFKFTLQGQIGVALRADDGKVRLTVSDTGVGIPEADLPRIFERFYRVDGQGGRTYEGTGIGLALVRDLVRLHGGEITVESVAAQGSTFTVILLLGHAHLPADRIGAQRRALAWTVTPAGAFVEETLRWLPAADDGTSVADVVIDDAAASAPDMRTAGVERARVLLADDNADMRDYLGRLLARGGYDVEAVADGEAALAAAARRKPDLVLTDVMMPRLDGLGLLATMRRDPVLFDVPVIVLSARAGEEARIEGIGVGADDYLVKPFSARELLARVGSNLSLARLRAEQLEAMSRLNELSSRLTTISDLPTLLYEVLDATIELQRADFGAIQLYDTETRTFEIVAQRGFESEFLDHFRSVRANEGSACGQAPKRRARILIEDVDLDPEFEPNRRIAAIAGFRAMQSTPLVEQGSGEAVGMLSTHFRNPHRPSERDLRLTDIYARQAADIIALRVSEQRLRESEERFRKFATHSNDVLWLFHVEASRLEYVSPAFEQVWGLPVDVPWGPDRWLETVHPDDRERAAEALERVFQGESAANEYRIVRPDGVVRWIRDTRFPIRDEEGRVRRVGGIAQDITKHSGGSLVYVVDADEASRQSLTLLLRGTGYEVKGFASARAFLEMAPALVTGCVLVDVRAPEAGGLTIPQELKARRILFPVIVLAEYDGDTGLGVRAMKAGSADFLQVPYERATLLTSIATALADIQDEAERDRTAERARARIAKMSDRERQVLDRMLAGGTNKTIAKELGLSPRTVEVHRARLMERLGAKTLPEAVLMAAAAGRHPPSSDQV